MRYLRTKLPGVISPRDLEAVACEIVNVACNTECYDTHGRPVKTPLVNEYLTFTRGTIKYTLDPEMGYVNVVGNAVLDCVMLESLVQARFMKMQRAGYTRQHIECANKTLPFSTTVLAKLVTRCVQIKQSPDLTVGAITKNKMVWMVQNYMSHPYHTGTQQLDAAEVMRPASTVILDTRHSMQCIAGTHSLNNPAIAAHMSFMRECISISPRYGLDRYLQRLSGVVVPKMVKMSPVTKVLDRKRMHYNMHVITEQHQHRCMNCSGLLFGMYYLDRLLRAVCGFCGRANYMIEPVLMVQHSLTVYDAIESLPIDALHKHVLHHLQIAIEKQTLLLDHDSRKNYMKNTYLVPGSQCFPNLVGVIKDTEHVNWVFDDSASFTRDTVVFEYEPSDWV